MPNHEDPEAIVLSFSYAPDTGCLEVWMKEGKEKFQTEKKGEFPEDEWSDPSKDPVRCSTVEEAIAIMQETERVLLGTNKED
jgi:hypothetical protein